MEVGEDGTDEEGLWGWDGVVERGGEVEEGEEFGGGSGWGSGETVVEEVEDASVRRLDKANETALEGWSVEVKVKANGAGLG